MVLATTGDGGAVPGQLTFHLEEYNVVNRSQFLAERSEKGTIRNKARDFDEGPEQQSKGGQDSMCRAPSKRVR